MGLGAMLALFLSSAQALEPDAADRVDVPANLRHPAIALPMDLRELLRKRDWPAASSRLTSLDTSHLVAPERADHAFLVVWSLVRAGRAEEAVKWLPLIADLSSAPLPYLAVTRAEVLQADGRTLEALAELDRVDPSARFFPRAAIVRAELLRELGRTAESAAILQALSERPDPANGGSLVLLTMARHKGIGSEESYGLLRRLWTWYPGTPEATEASTLLPQTWPERKPTDAERVTRAERAMDGGMWDAALQTLAAVAVVPPVTDPVGCRYAYVKGRSLYKKNTLSESVAAFGQAGFRCGLTPEDYGGKILYLHGFAEYRRGRMAESAAAYGAIANLYPTSTMADDGLSRGGISLYEAGDIDGALKLWERALSAYPAGDMVPEATFRLAWARYQQGRPAEAVAVAEQLGALDPLVDAWAVIGGRYWAARWMMYPDATDPRRIEETGRQEAIDGWRELIRTQPQSFYAMLAWSRLMEVAPEIAREVAVRPPADHGFGPWNVRGAFFRSPAVGAGVALARLGLVGEAMEEWATADLMAAEADEVAWLQELRVSVGDWLSAHKWIQQYLRVKAVGSLGPHSAQVVTVGWPDRYWTDVQQAAGGYSYEPRMFHALVREESSFDARIMSHSGARGLSQVMPATAREVAGWLGRSITMEQLLDPHTNLTLGTRYFESVYRSNKQNPFLAMASYNGGPTRIKNWAVEWGNPPTDEYVERIPIRETRDYVKKVGTSWQVMRYAFDRDDPPFPDLSAFNHQAMP